MKNRIPAALFSFLALAGVCFGQSRWWMEEPVRFVQTNLRETDSTLDAEELVRQIAEFPANAFLLNMGGITAHYPTKVEYHYASPYLPEGRDMFGDVLRLAHGKGIRLIGRFDFSKTQKPVYEAHPEWFFKKHDGSPVEYNGLYSTCINAGYYRGHIFKILREALENYAVDGLFFNMFGNPSSDYSGNPVGLCHCGECRRLFRARYNREIPERPDAQYSEFMNTAKMEVAESIGRIIHEIRPDAAFLTYIQEHVDGIMSESNTSVTRPLPMWPYSASDNVNRARNSKPSKMAFNLCMTFVDYAWRFAAVPPAEISLRLWQNMAHGAGPAFAMVGQPDQEDMSAIRAARPVFEWHRKNEDMYVGQQSAARVLLLGGPQPSYRGIFRILSEAHIPFAASENLEWLADGRAQQFDLVISTRGAAPELENWVRAGGRLLVAGTVPPSFGVGKPVKEWEKVKGYFRVRDHELFPSLEGTNVIFLDGDYTELEPAGAPALTLIPPSMFGPPEKIHTDWHDTDKPGLLMASHGSGEVAYLPWDLGALYYRNGSRAHAALFSDLVDRLLPSGRQIRTAAHPLVEMTLMEQPQRNRKILHLVNGSGHSGTTYFEPLPMSELRIGVQGEFKSARSTGLGT
jgi:hypothetical protein